MQARAFCGIRHPVSEQQALSIVQIMDVKKAMFPSPFFILIQDADA